MSIFNTFKPLIFKLNESTFNIKDIDYNIEFSNDNSYPLLKLGYNHFILQNLHKYNTDGLKKNENRSNLKYITEPFTIKEFTTREEKKTSIIDNVNNLINSIDKNIPKVDNNYFTQLWEMILYFDLLSDKSVKVMNITDSNSYFIESCIIYRLLINSKLDKDEFIVDNTENNFVKYFKKNINNKYSKNSIDLITTEIHNIEGDKILSEQKSFKTILDHIYTILDAQSNGGDLVLKIYDNYTYVSLNMIEFIKSFYDEAYICKPFTSLSVNSEKYLICKNFKKSKVSKDVMENIKKIIKTMNDNKDYNIYYLLENLEINDSNIKLYKEISNKISQHQYIGINNMFEYLNLENKFGSEFHEILNKYDNATEFWSSVFLNKKNFDNIKYLNSKKKSSKGGKTSKKTTKTKK